MSLTPQNCSFVKKFRRSMSTPLDCRRISVGIPGHFNFGSALCIKVFFNQFYMKMFLFCVRECACVNKIK